MVVFRCANPPSNGILHGCGCKTKMVCYRCRQFLARPPQPIQERDALRLWASVMQTAIGDLKDKSIGIRRRTNSWFLSSNHGIGSFIWCCDQLSLNPERVLKALERRGLAAWPKAVAG